MLGRWAHKGRIGACRVHSKDRHDGPMTGRAVIIAALFLGTAVAGAMVGVGVIGAGTGCGGGAFCHDDRPRVPAPGTTPVREGAPCTLPNGRPGIGAGIYGCYDPTLCHCTPEAGSAMCAAGAVCVFAACNGANEGAACSLPGGGQGTCCSGTCSTIDLRTDLSNCGGCGYVCPDGVTCDYGACYIPTSTSPACPAGLVLARTNGVAGTCSGCFPVSCTGLPDGAPCVTQLNYLDYAGQIEQVVGLCCRSTCVDPGTDDQNCGGCGVTCCPGTHCHSAFSNGTTGGCT